MRTRMPFEIGQRIEESLTAGFAGVALLLELFRVSGAAGEVDEQVRIRRRRRGATEAEVVESLLALWAAGGERCEDLDRLRQDQALARLLGHAIASTRVARDFLEGFHDKEAAALWQGQAGSGNWRVLKSAIAALPPGVDQVRVRGDSALYEHEVLDGLAGAHVGFAISADMSPQLRAAILALPEGAWQVAAEEAGAPRQWAEVALFPEDSRSPQPHRCLAHKMRNLEAKVPADRWPACKSEAWACYTAASPALAGVLHDQLVATWKADLPTAVVCFTVHLRLPIAHRIAARTTNLLERLFGEERRRT